MLDSCAVCSTLVEEERPVGIGSMLFHSGCLPTCRFCRRPYRLDEAGWDFRGGVAWTDESGYVPRLQSAACGACSDIGERRDYGPGW